MIALSKIMQKNILTNTIEEEGLEGGGDDDENVNS